MLKELISQIPDWYIIVGILWGIFQGIRGIIEQKRNYKDRLFKCTNCEKIFTGNWNNTEKWIILYIHDFAFRFVCTLAGFIALFLVYIIVCYEPQIINVSSGTAVILMVLSFIGIIGVGGQLHYIILIGKWPK